MGFMTYKEQLLHPNWQRKRLEMLDLAGFECSCCADKEKTLHVHHKRYIKGRMAWEYEASDLEVLCETCHKSTHSEKERLDLVLAELPSGCSAAIAALVIGFFDEQLDDAHWLTVDESFACLGRVARVMQNVSTPDAMEVHDIFMQIGPDRFMEAIRHEVRKDMAAS